MKKTLALTVAGGLMVSTALAQDRELTVVSWGGSYQEAQSKALFGPAAENMGITVKEETYSGMSDVRLQVNTGQVSYDVVVTGTGSGARAAEEGLLEPLDYDVIDVSNFMEGSYSDYCIAGDAFSVVFAYNTDAFPDGGPQTWADFFDPENFPGARAYRGKVSGALEPALLADGVPMDEVYDVLDSEEGIARAIDKIRSIKDEIAVFWTSGAQHAQLMKDGEVDMSSGWNGRFENARNDGGKIAFGFDGGLLDYDCFAVPKGAPNTDLAMEFIAEISKAEYQDDLPTYIMYGPPNELAYETGTITPEVAAMLPSSPENAAKQLSIDTEWYAEWETIAEEMYQEMLTE